MGVARRGGLARASKDHGRHSQSVVAGVDHAVVVKMDSTAWAAVNNVDISE